MTVAELARAVGSKKRVREIEARERASFDYILADLIGRSMARLHSSANRYPSIADAYPGLFQKDEIEEQFQVKKDELSALRFKQFAEIHNKKLEGAKN